PLSTLCPYTTLFRSPRRLCATFKCQLAEEVNMTNQFTPGLEGIIAVQTSISNLDVVESRILIKGFDLIELAGKKKYLDVAHLLIDRKSTRLNSSHVS